MERICLLNKVKWRQRNLWLWFWLKTLRLFCQFSDLSMLQTLWMKEFSYCTSQLELISITSDPKSLNEQKNIIKSNRRAKNCQLPPIWGYLFSASHPKMLSYLYESLPIVHEIPDIYSISWSFPNSPGSPYGFSQRAVFLNFNLFSGAKDLIFLILKVPRNLYYNLDWHKEYSYISNSLGTVLSRSLMNKKMALDFKLVKTRSLSINKNIICYMYYSLKKQWLI